MGFYLRYALSRYGRPQDELSHVLVNAAFESHASFYYPPTSPRPLQVNEKTTVTTADARIMLARIPFLRLRDGMDDALVAGALSHGDRWVASSTQSIALNALMLYLIKNTACAATTELQELSGEVPLPSRFVCGFRGKSRCPSFSGRV